MTCPVLSQSFQALGCLHTGHSTDLTYTHSCDNLVAESSAGSVLIFLGLSSAFDVADPPPSGKSPHTDFRVSCHWQFLSLFHSQTSTDGELAGPSPSRPPPPPLIHSLHDLVQPQGFVTPTTPKCLKSGPLPLTSSFYSMFSRVHLPFHPTTLTFPSNLPSISY